MRVRSRRWFAGGGTTAVKVLAAMTAVGCCLAAAAYATTRPPQSAPDTSQPLRPRIVEHPESVTDSPTAEFDFSQPARPPARAAKGIPVRFECRLDDEEWELCVGPVTLRGVGRGTHRFLVRAVNHSGTNGPTASFDWRRTSATAPPAVSPAPAVESQPAPAPSPPPVETPAEPPVIPPVEPPVTGIPFSIEQVGSLEDLYPGEPAQTIDVRIENPNPSPISIVSLAASIASSPPGCPAAENFVLTGSAIDPGAPLVVAAESTLTLPAQGISGPTIAMLELPVSQDACQAAELEIALSGEATG
jgi:hypothetical protein